MGKRVCVPLSYFNGVIEVKNDDVLICFEAEKFKELVENYKFKNVNFKDENLPDINNKEDITTFIPNDDKKNLHKKIDSKIIENLDKETTLQGKSDTEVAKRLYISKQSFSRIKKNGYLTVASLLYLSQKLKISVSALLKGTKQIIEDSLKGHEEESVPEFESPKGLVRQIKHLLNHDNKDTENILKRLNEIIQKSGSEDVKHFMAVLNKVITNENDCEDTEKLLQVIVNIKKIAAEKNVVITNEDIRLQLKKLYDEIKSDKKNQS